MQDHIQFARVLGGTDHGSPLTDDAAISNALHDDRPAWLHLQADHPETDPWIDTHLEWLDPSIRDALTEPQTRPRALRLGDGLLVNLRGINTNVGKDPEDMVSVRLYIDSARIVSMSRFRLRSIEGLGASIDAGQGPQTAGAFLADLIERLTDLVEAQVENLEDRADQLEEASIADPIGAHREEVSDQRLELTELRRYMAPQRDAVRTVVRSGVPWLTEADIRKIDEQLDQITRVTEALEATREQLQAIRDEIEGAKADRLNRNLYILSVVSAVFLPLGFLTGLMGINIAGMPGTDWPPAFWVFTGGLCIITAVALLLMHRTRILRPTRGKR
ncbi:zinc transporter ZntB [Palleronia abyssalis]|uniref:Zinc transport protein ZntB n=1 Tax=Palleronia abyssalis TaxID=1501240 RepID=A0A2R8BXL8_9RHOB|nr:zinc transporter ZntB [Palleronia abyssalis]SPJ24927.1 Zinc transport protein ZntB [Palleronia abyssalis]